jgi:hypothetical protein
MARRAPWQKATQVLTCRDGDVTTVLALRTGRYHTLNALGGFVWDLLDLEPDLDTIVGRVCAEFEATEVEIRTDVTELLQRLSSLRLVRQSVSVADQPVIRQISPSAPKNSRGATLPSALSVSWLIARTRFLLKTRGLLGAAHAAYRLALSRDVVLSPETVAALVRRVNRAATLSPFRAECLERSLTVVWALRNAGMNAKLRLAIRHYPFEAHAWADHNGVPLNELGSVCALYVPFPPLEPEMLQCGR